MGAALRRLVDRGACVAICIGNRVEGVESYLGVTRAGAVGAYLNPAASDGELAYMLDDSGAEVLLTDNHLSERTWELAERAPRVNHVFVVDADGPANAHNFAELVNEDEAHAP